MSTIYRFFKTSDGYKNAPVAEPAHQHFKMYCDPGHGWLAVKRNFLKKLGILSKISGYSYQKGQTVYLEEDGDLSLFLEAIEKTEVPYTIEYKHTNKTSPIRSYESFTFWEVMNLQFGGTIILGVS